MLSAAKVCLQERLLSDRMEGSKNVQHIGQILDLFLDDSIADSVSFGEIKRRAFSILERDKIRRAADFIGAHSIDVTALEWEFVANLAPMFKMHLRPLLRHLPLAGSPKVAPRSVSSSCRVSKVPDPALKGRLRAPGRTLSLRDEVLRRRLDVVRNATCRKKEESD